MWKTKDCKDWLLCSFPDLLSMSIFRIIGTSHLTKKLIFPPSLMSWQWQMNTQCNECMYKPTAYSQPHSSYHICFLPYLDVLDFLLLSFYSMITSVVSYFQYIHRFYSLLWSDFPIWVLLAISVVHNLSLTASVPIVHSFKHPLSPSLSYLDFIHIVLHLSARLFTV
jgi:hypothetical protein